jgi:micrococcal nuclease
MRTAPLIALLLVLLGPASAQPSGPFDAAAGQHARLVGVRDGTLALDDGRSIRLAAIHVPRSRAADVALEALLGGDARIVTVSDHADRYGRFRAHAFAADGRWAQAFLIALGLARVDTQIDERRGAADLLAMEAAARAAQRGIWARPEYRIRTVDEAFRAVDTFQIVEGRVARVERKSGRTRLVFGAQADRELVAVVSAKARRLFAEVGLDPVGFDGKMLRLRGWIKYRNGAFIDVTHPEQIELLEP